MVFHIVIQRVIKPMAIDANYSETKNKVIKAERQMLRDLGFCVHFKHPHKVRYHFFIHFTRPLLTLLTLAITTNSFTSKAFYTNSRSFFHAFLELNLTNLVSFLFDSWNNHRSSSSIYKRSNAHKWSISVKKHGKKTERIYFSIFASFLWLPWSNLVVERNQFKKSSTCTVVYY